MTVPPIVWVVAAVLLWFCLASSSVEAEGASSSNVDTQRASVEEMRRQLVMVTRTDLLPPETSAPLQATSLQATASAATTEPAQGSRSAQAAPRKEIALPLDRLSHPAGRYRNNVGMADRNTFGDRLYIVQSGQSRQSLSVLLTGLESRWSDIAAHNKLDPTASPEPGQLLYIPRWMEMNVAGLSGQGDTRVPDSGSGKRLRSVPSTAASQRGISEAESLLRNIDEPEASDNFEKVSLHRKPIRQASLMASLGSGSSRPDSTTAEPVTLEFSDTAASRNIDMFAGQARVFGKVSVSRVAVGNGGLLRAEVLENGDLLAIALGPGSSSLHLWHKDGSQSNLNIRISESDPEIRVRLDKSVRMRVKMVEFRKTALERIGIDWGDSIEGPLFATVGDAMANSLFRPDQSAALGASATLPLGIQPFSSYFGLATQLTSRINLMVNRGEAEMLAEPVLSCKNGGTARFLAGGEVPYPALGSNGQTTVNFREYGIRLEITPRVDGADNIQADIMTEVSSIDQSVSVMGAPGLLTRRTQTTVSTTAGNTIVIAGLMQVDEGKDRDNLPGLGRIPVVGRLFGSDNSRNNVSELVIFITPEVVDPGDMQLSARNRSTYEHVQQRLDNASQLIEQSRNR